MDFPLTSKASMKNTEVSLSGEDTAKRRKMSFDRDDEDKEARQPFSAVYLEPTFASIVEDMSPAEYLSMEFRDMEQGGGADLTMHDHGLPAKTFQCYLRRRLPMEQGRHHIPVRPQVCLQRPQCGRDCPMRPQIFQCPWLAVHLSIPTLRTCNVKHGVQVRAEYPEVILRCLHRQRSPMSSHLS